MKQRERERERASQVIEMDEDEMVSPRVKAMPQPDGSMMSGKLEAMWPVVSANGS